MSQFSRNLGFTLAELVVSISIVSIIMAILVWNQSAYNDISSLTNLADDISLTVSQAQVYGIGIREFSPGTQEFGAAYGLAFSLLPSDSNTAYIYFANLGVDEIYSDNWTCPIGLPSECLQKFNITRGNIIQSICSIDTSNATDCTVGRTDFTFARPNIAANIKFFNMSGNLYTPVNNKGVEIRLRSPKGQNRSVVVYKTGQVSVQ